VIILSPRVTVIVLAYVTLPEMVKLPVIVVSPDIVPPDDENFVLAKAKAPLAYELALLAY